MNERISYLLKNVGILAISNFTSKILVFLMVPLYTSVLSTSEFGSYDIITSTITLLLPILTANIIDGVMRFSLDSHAAKAEVAAIGLKYITISIILVAGLLVVVSHSSVFPEIDGLEHLIFIYYVGVAINTYFTQFAKGLELIRDLGIAGVLSTMVAALGNVLFLLVFSWGIKGFFLANILSLFTAIIYLGIKINIRKLIRNFYINNSLERQMIAYSCPLIATTIGWWAISAFDRYVVTFMCGLSANGLLSVAYKIPAILAVFQGIFISAWQITAVKEYGKSDAAVFYGRSFCVINMLMSLICGFLILLSATLANFLYAKDFYLAWQYVPFLLISCVFNCMGGFLGPILSARKDSVTMAKSALCGTATNVVLNLVLVCLMDIQGATIATAISSYSIYQYRKSSLVNEIYFSNYEIVVLTWLLICLQAIICIYTDAFIIQITCLLMSCFLNKQYISEAFKTIVKLSYNLIK